MQPGRNLPQLLKGTRVHLGGRHLAVNPVEQHHITLAAVGQTQRQHALALAIGYRLRHHNAGFTQRIQPQQFAENIRFLMVVAAMQPQRIASAARLEQEGGIF